MPLARHWKALLLEPVRYIEPQHDEAGERSWDSPEEHPEPLTAARPPERNWITPLDTDVQGDHEVVDESRQTVHDELLVRSHFGISHFGLLAELSVRG